MGRTILFCLALIFAVPTVYSQKTKTVSASYTYYAPESMSVDEAKRTALERAKIQAIADEFGTVVSQSNSTVISNNNGESDSRFLSLGGSDVKGEWVETIGEPVYNIRFEDHLLVVTCDVKGKAKEITASKIDFTAIPLRNGTSLKYESTDFRDGDDLYLYFKSPIDGNLSVYLIDNEAEVYCILPYHTGNGTAYKVSKDEEYILFSQKYETPAKRREVVEYTMTCSGDREFNNLVVVFSSEDFSKAKLNKMTSHAVPPSLKYEDFKKWLHGLSKHSNIQTKEIQITVSK